jgi:hypothetical protein
MLTNHSSRLPRNLQEAAAEEAAAVVEEVVEAAGEGAG